MNNGSFTISLDFELLWGVLDKKILNNYKKNIIGVQTIIPKLLKLFKKYDIHVTWAVVGFLYHKNFQEFNKFIPKNLPEYKNTDLSPYLYVKDKLIDKNLKLFFANELIKNIQKTKGQEIASHTYSHFYTMEDNLNKESFKDDIIQMNKIFNINDIELKFIVFPRNQIDKNSLKLLEYNSDIKVYRGNSNHWAYKNGDVDKTFLLRVFRFFDIYFNLSGSHIFYLDNLSNICEVKSSMFFRAYSNKFSFLENLKLNRIKKAMKEAAINKGNFHLWWHPHDFGINQEKNLNNLETILKYYKKLKKDYGMKSLNMGELIDE